MTTKLKAPLAFLVAAGAFLLVSASNMPAQLPEDKKPPGEKPAALLEGVYTVVSGEKDGNPVPEERLKGFVVAFSADRIVGMDRDKKEFFAANYTLDTAAKPWVIKMKATSPKDAESTGLIKREGDTVTIVYALPGAPAPTDFRTKGKQHLFVLKEVAKK